MIIIVLAHTHIVNKWKALFHISSTLTINGRRSVLEKLTNIVCKQDMTLILWSGKYIYDTVKDSCQLNSIHLDIQHIQHLLLDYLNDSLV